ncbi:hypothetical protein G7Y89_g5797 [Cudoniella acicularis]|uniref:Nephrocystin 3-like N-terminal domain-containing protein n=1 Tax=Cudoniella acicularis TaxID=354080 RepID=A0A8H4W3N0_9HELO|nr:hypothetical protein G7Y89_g5797 [Cudoniella acicularis]
MVSVIAVHGLGGDSEDTWTYNGDGEKVMWLRDLLPAHLEDPLTMSFGYTLNCEKGILATSIQDIAVRLLDELHAKRKLDDTAQNQNRPLVFIGHDLGGIIIKQTLLIAAGSQHHSAIAARTSHLVFFGTPHRNSGNESWESIAFRLMLMTGQTFDDSLNDVLEQTSQTLMGISSEFLKMPRIYSIINCLEQPRGLASTLGLSPILATLGIYGEKSIVTDKSHADICKIHDKDDTALLLIANSINGTAISLASSFEAKYLTLASKSTILREQYLDCLRTLSMPESKVYPPGVVSPLLETTRWITKHDAYKAFLDQSQLLWLYGVPGSGISKTASLLAEIASTELSGASIIRFSFDSRDERHGSTYGMLASLSHQLLSLKPSLFNHVLLLYEKISEEMPWRLDRIWAFFRSLLSCPYHGATICLIDRVDECEDAQDQFLAELLLLPDNTNMNFKLVVTSRVGPDRNIQPHAVTMTTDMKEVKPEDVPSMLGKELSDLIRIRPALHKFEDTIKRKLQAPSLNLLTATLTLKLLQASETQSTYSLMEEELYAIPSTLTELYRHFINKIPPERYQWSKKVLSWIIHAKRPLKPEELTIALVLEDGVPSLSHLQKAMPQELSLDLQNVFGQLIKIKNGEISLIDKSLRDLLLEGNLGPGEETWAFDDHSTLAEQCLKYLSLITKECQAHNPDFKQLSILERYHGGLRLHFPSEDKGQYDFIPYATQYWPKHYSSHNGEVDQSQDVRRRARAFWMEKDLIEIWSQLHWYYEIPIKQRQLPSKDPLLVACRLGCADLVDTILNKPESSSHLLSIGLEIAIENGDYAIIDLLVGRGAQSELALHKAAQHGRGRLIERFLMEGLRVTAVDPFTGLTPLHLASTIGYHSVVELLLAALPAAVDVDAMNMDGLTALHLASQFGHTAVMEKLLRKGANPNAPAPGSHSFTPLHMSSQWQQPHAVATLLEASADIGADDEDGQTPLHIAAGSGCVDIAEIFLKHATGLNELLRKKDRQGRTALHVAACEGHGLVVSVLLSGSELVEYPGATSMGDQLGCTPLHLAVQNGHYSAVEALITKDRIMEKHAGAGSGNQKSSIERTDKESSVPIHLAVQNGQIEIVGLLCGGTCAPGSVSRHIQLVGLESAAYGVWSRAWRNRNRRGAYPLRGRRRHRRQGG